MAAKDRCKRDSDIATAGPDHTTRQRRQVKGIVGRDRQLAARNVRLVGRAAGRDQDVLGTMSLAVDLDRVRIAQSRMTTDQPGAGVRQQLRSEEHTSELQSLMRISYAVFCLKKKKKKQT